MKKIIVAIDGYSSSGKSTMAKRLAADVGYIYVDTGAMYRAVALYCLRNNMIDDNTIDEQRLQSCIDSIEIDFVNVDGKQCTRLNGEVVESEIRTLQVANYASRVSALGFVRVALVAIQQKMGEQKGIVMDGRDIGTVVFPHAEMKFFVTALPEVRAQRRYEELKAKGDMQTYEDVLANVIERDNRDVNRSVGPLRQADNAVLIDNSYLTIEEQYTLLRLFFKSVAGY